MVEWNVLPKKAFDGKAKEAQLEGARAFVLRLRGEEPTIYLPEGKATTKDKLHELYHAKYSPDLEEIERGVTLHSARMHVREEIRADEFARRKIGKENDDLFVSQIRLGAIAGSLLDWGYRPSQIIGAIQQALEEEGYERLDKESASALWWRIREEYDKEKSSDG